MKKRIISIVLCLALCLSCLPMNAFAEDDTDELSVAETDASELLPADEDVQSAEICDTLPAVEGFSDDLAELETAQTVLSDNLTGITLKLTSVQLPEGISAEDVNLSVSALSEDESSTVFSEAIQGKQIVAYDISLTTADGVIQPVSPVQVGIPVPDDFADKLSVLHRQDGNIETISCDVKDGTAWFEAVHFSPYALVSENSHTADCYANADEPTDVSDAAEKNPDVSSLALGGDSAVGVQFDEEDTAAVLRLLGTTEGLNAFSLGGDEWSFDMYYINYSNALATTKNQTTLDLIGNGMESLQNLKYQFEFHNSTDYEIGDVSITIPRSLYIDRTGNPVNPTDIGVPAAPAVSKASSFNYHIETVDGVEYLVFTNFKKIIAGSNNLVQVFYKLDDMMTVDETSWDIRAQLCIGGQDVSGDIVLHGSMDTETNLYVTNKEPYIPTTEGSIYPEVYTWNQVKQWSNLQGEAPDDFDEYRYVLWRTELWGNASQPWNLTVVDTPSHDGEVIGQSLSEYKEGDSIFAVFDDGVFTFGEEPWYKLSNSNHDDIYLFTLVRYPIDSFPVDNKVENHIEVTLTGVDDNIPHTLTSDASHIWEDYVWTYAGDLYGVGKWYYDWYKPSVKEEPGWIDAYLKAAEQGSDYALPRVWDVVGSARGFSAIIADADASYTFNIIDDLQYVTTNQGGYTLLTPDDYHYGSVVFRGCDYDMDIYEDQTAPAKTGKPFNIYVMTADNRGQWQLAAQLPYEQYDGYALGEEWLSKGVYSVKVEHEIATYSSDFSFYPTTVLHRDSARLQGLIADDNNTYLVIRNLAGGYAEFDGQIVSDSDIYSFGSDAALNAEIEAYDRAQYGQLIIRDSDAVRLTRLSGTNHVEKKVSAKNDPANTRVNLTYSIAGYDGYSVFSQGAVDLLRAENLTPARDSIKIYDLLPLGVVFNPSAPITVGQVTRLDANFCEARSWNAKNISVDWKVTDDYRGSARQMVEFTLRYTGNDEGNVNYDALKEKWYCGWGVQFGAYYLWDNYSDGSTGINVAAFATDTPIKGHGFVDDGTGAPRAAGTDDAGRSFFYDPEDDGVAAEPYLIYAQVSNNDDVAVATKANIEKLVKENSDIYGEPASDASVCLGGKYTYTLTVHNAQGTLKDIVIYDRLESGRTDHAGFDPRVFEDSDWHGVLAGVNTVEARSKGIAPVVYYSADSEQTLSLSASGWVKASDWTLPVSDVKAVAVDLSKKSTGEGFVLNALEAVNIGIVMLAPEEMQEATYAYNVPVFDSISIADDGNETTESGVMGNSAAVSLYEPTSFVIEKHIKDDPAAPQDEEFEFTVAVNGVPYANKEYRLIDDNGSALPGVHGTDVNGVLRLHGGEKAVFKGVPAGAEYSVTESYMANWKPSPDQTVSGTFAEGEENTASFINEFVHPLYFEKIIENDQDYSDAENTEFTFILTLDGQLAAGVPYALVDPETPVSREPAVIEKNLCTGEDGSFRIQPGQRAMFWVATGAEYRFEEIDLPADYICSNPVAQGTVTRNYASASITNSYALKDLYVSKTVEALENITFDADKEFSFVLKLDGEPCAADYILYEADSKGDDVEVSHGTTGIDGTFTLKADQKIRFIRILRGTRFEVTEIDDPNDLFDVKSPQSGVASGFLPMFALSANAKFVNESALRTLEVSKSVITTEDVSNQEFRFTLTLNGETAANVPYILKTDGAADQSMTTDENGSFALTSVQHAVFPDLAAGTEYSVHEIPTAGFKQVSPVDDGDFSGVIPTEMKPEQVTFVNQDENAERMLIINKKVVSDDPRIANASLYKRDQKWESQNGEWVLVEEHFVYGEGALYQFYIEVNDAPYSNSPFTRIDANGAITVEQTDADGGFKIRATDTVIIDSLQVGDTYSVSEEQLGIWERLYAPDPETGVDYYLKFTQIDPANDGSVGGTIGTAPTNVQITNKLYPVTGLNIEKAINSTNMWYDDVGPVKGKIIFRLQLRDKKTGEIITGPDTFYYMQYGGEYDQLCRPDENGYFEMWIDTTATDESGRIEEYYGEIDGYMMAGYDIKIEEIRAEPESLLGKFTGLMIDELYEMDEDGFIIMGDTTYLWLGFGNTTETKPFRVQKDVPDATETDLNTDFEFTLYKSDPFIEFYSYGYDEKFVPQEYRPMPNEPYTLYDAVSGTLLGSGRTDANGVFTLKAGQYAEFVGLYITPKHDYYDFDQDFAQVHYKVVETPYSNYTPQVTINDNGTQTVLPGSNSGIILAGQNIYFLNTYDNISSLIVTKEVTARSGVVIPKDDEFTFTLKVDGKAYGKQEYRRFASTGNEIFNVQTINGFEVTEPWTTDRFGNFVLKNGERAVFEWVGAGKQYEIVEEARDGYTQITPAAGTGISDVITEDGSVAAFVNSYDKTKPSDGTTLTVRKLIALPAGVTEAPDEEFTFRVTVAGEAYAMKTYALYRSDGTLVNDDLNTTAEGELTLKGNQYAVLKKVPLNQDYEVEEILSDASLYTPIGNTVAAGATAAKGATANFTNAFGNLLVTKKVTSKSGQTAPADDVFTFTITSGGNALANTAYWTVDSTGKKSGEGITDASGGFTLKDGETAMFFGLAVGTEYSVMESGKRYYTQTVPVSKDGYSGTVGDTADNLVFVNDYSRMASLEISKTVIDGNADAAEQFTFQITLGGKLYANKSYTVYGADGYQKAGIFTTSDTGTVTLLNGECAMLTGIAPGASYSVQEINIPDGFTAVKEIIAGIIASDGSVAAFENASNYRVTYVVNPDETYGIPEDSVTPTDDTKYSYEDPVTIADDLTTTQGYAVDPNNGDEVPGTWTFTPWDKEDFQITEDTTITGSWTFTPDTYEVTYVVNGDPVYGTPADSTTPTDENNPYGYKEQVTVKENLTTTQDYAVDPNTGNEVPGTWTFTPWDKEDFEITEDTTITGAWTFTPNTYEVTYVVNGDPSYGTPADGTAPTDEKNPYDYKEQVTVKDDLTTTWTTSDGTSDGVPGTWTFTPWDKEDFQITEDTTITGAWTFTPDTAGNLTVSKTISGNAADSTKAFDFTVTLGDTSINGTYGDLSFINGVASFTLKGGESRTATGLPAGISYKVAEADYSADGYVTTKSGDIGTITDGKTATAAFTNTKDTTPPTDPKVGNLTVSKTISGNAADSTKAFDFTVTLGDTSVNGVYGGMVFINGVASFTLKGGESRTATGLPAGTTFTVSEADYSTDGYVTTKSGDTGTITDGQTATAAFTNTRNVEPIPTYGNLTVSKNVTGDLGDKTKYFTFKVEFNVDGTFNYTGSKTGTITSGGTVQLKHGESITIVDIPAGTSYTVTESGNSGYSVYASGDTGIISDGKTSTAKFTNTRSSVPKTGDNSNMPLWFSLMGVSVLGMIGTLFIKTKKRRIGTHFRNK